jgi:hypothetical protein
LGRFVVPAARLEEFDAAARGFYGDSDWQISALIGDAASELPIAQQFNQTHRGTACADALEFKATSALETAAIASLLEKETAEAFIEIPLRDDSRELLAAMALHGLRAKIRTGGLTADKFPEAGLIARFLRACADARVAFKATAGLHHPVRCVKPFTYEPNSATGQMHGFLNVFLGAALAWKGADLATLENILLEEDANEFRFSEDSVECGGKTLTVGDIAAARAQFAISFGSCSFEEPIADLLHLGLLTTSE